MRYSLFILIFFLAAVFPAAASPEEGSGAALQRTDLGDIAIESRSFKWIIKEKTVVFDKDVTARREDLTINCDNISVTYHESENEDVEYDRILATGNVKITRADGLSGAAEKAVYDFDEDTVVMTGQPVFKQGKNSWEGSSLTYHVSEGYITGTDVKAVLHQENKEGVLTSEP